MSKLSNGWFCKNILLGHLQNIIIYFQGGDIMLKTLSAQIKEYKKASILAPFFIVCEVIVELLIPFLMASIIDKGVSSGNMKHVYLIGGIMVLMATCSLTFGV